MRVIPVGLVSLALVAAGAAQAGVRMHLPHKRHPHADGAKPTAADAPPVSDIPEPVWTSKPRG